MQIIPLVPSIADYYFTVTLSTTAVRFDVHWNLTEQAWYLDATQVDGPVVFVGAKVVIGAFLGRTSRHSLMTEGAIIARDFSRSDRDPTFDDLGIRVQVFFVENALLALPDDVVTE